MKNLTTATAVTSDGTPAPAGSRPRPTATSCRPRCSGGSPTFSNPLLFNNIFWDNRAGTRAGTTVTGLGLGGDASADRPLGPRRGRRHGPLAPTNSVVQQSAGDAPVHHQPDEQHRRPAGRRSLRRCPCPSRPGGRTRRSSTPPSWTRRGSARTCSATTTCGCPAARQPATSGAAQDGAAYQSPPTRRRPRLRRPGPAGTGRLSTQGPTSSVADHAASAADRRTSTSPPLGNTNPPGVNGTADDADIYRWNGTAFSRASTCRRPVQRPGQRERRRVRARGRDALLRLLHGHRDPVRARLDRRRGRRLLRRRHLVDVLRRQRDDRQHPGWSHRSRCDQCRRDHPLLLDGHGPGASRDRSRGDNADIYRWNGGTSFTRVVDASARRTACPRRRGANANVDGLHLRRRHPLLRVVLSTTTPVPGLATCRTRTSCTSTRGDLVGALRRHGHGLTAATSTSTRSRRDRSLAPPPPPPPPPRRPSRRSATPTRPGSPEQPTTPTSTAGTARPSRVVRRDRARDARPRRRSTATSRVDATHFYLSFSAARQLPGRAGEGRGRGPVRRRHVVSVLRRGNARARRHRRRRDQCRRNDAVLARHRRRGAGSRPAAGTTPTSTLGRRSTYTRVVDATAPWPSNRGH